MPSENLTRPLWKAPDADEYRRYVDSSKLTLSQSNEVKYTFGSQSEDGLALSTDLRAGLFFNNEISAGSPFLMAETTTLNGHVGIHATINYTKSEGTALAGSVARLSTLSDQLVTEGDWEPESSSNWLNPEVGRRFVPDNTGYALVKSLTADLFASFLSNTGAMVSLDTIPNPDIPEDVNVIAFPMNPEYTTAGILDGRVGYVQAPQFLAGAKQQSYFKPIEAYKLKRQIEYETAQAQAYYNQFRVKPRKEFEARVPNHDDEQRDVYFDWAKGIARKSLVNTYVWTAAGGLHTEEEQFLSARSEQYSGNYKFSSMIGLDARAEGAYFVGVYLEFDFLVGGHLDVTITKGREESNLFALTGNVNGDSFLKRWVGDDHGYTGPSKDGYSTTNCPGKVQGYRFMSFYLAPDTRNGRDFSMVVAPHWLRQSGDPNAAALASAKRDENGVWRVMHRVTFVDRVPPEYQSLADETSVDIVQAPPFQDDNSEIIALVIREIGEDRTPTPADIGDAITQVTGLAPGDPANPVLAKVLPWWNDFLAAAQVLGSSERDTFLAFRRDLLAYMIAFYATSPGLQ